LHLIRRDLRATYCVDLHDDSTAYERLRSSVIQREVKIAPDEKYMVIGHIGYDRALDLSNLLRKIGMSVGGVSECTPRACDCYYRDKKPCRTQIILERVFLWPSLVNLKSRGERLRPGMMRV